MNDSRARSWLERAAFASLAVLAGILPFELRTGVRLAGLEITNVEAVLYTTILIWAGWRIATGTRRPARWTSVHTAVLAWAAVLIVSAVIAETSRIESLKFALRSVGGCVLFAVVADLTTSRRGAAALVGALAAGGVVSAMTGVAEGWMPGMAGALAPFKTQPSVVAGFLRASGTFQYANTAAMYWEATFPVVVCLGIMSPNRRTRWLMAAAAWVLIEAVILTVSRAAFWNVCLALIAVGWLGWLRSRKVPAAAIAAAAGLIGLTLVDIGTSGLLARRLRGDEPSVWYRAASWSMPASMVVGAGETTGARVHIVNNGRLAWPSRGRDAVFLSYHWYDRTSARLLAYQGIRTRLPHDVAPGSGVSVDAQVFGAFPPGEYEIEWDLVHEGVTWFGAVGSPTARTPIVVTPGRSSARLPPQSPPPAIDIPPRPSRRELWTAAVRLWRQRPVIGIGPDNFRRLYGPELGLERFDDRLQASSLYVEALVGQGMLGLGVWSWLVVALLAACRRAWRQAQPASGPALEIGVPVALGAFLIHGVVDYFLPFTPTYGLFWMLAGLLVGLERMPPHSS